MLHFICVGDEYLVRLTSILILKIYLTNFGFWTWFWFMGKVSEMIHPKTQLNKEEEGAKISSKVGRHLLSIVYLLKKIFIKRNILCSALNIWILSG